MHEGNNEWEQHTAGPTSLVFMGRNLKQRMPKIEAALRLPAGTVTNVGGSQAHENMQPYIAVNFCIAIQGLFPSRN